MRPRCGLANLVTTLTLPKTHGAQQRRCRRCSRHHLDFQLCQRGLVSFVLCPLKIRTNTILLECANTHPRRAGAPCAQTPGPAG